MSSKIYLAAVGLAVVLLVVVAAPLRADGDPNRGRLKAETCTGCHGIPGYKNVYPTYRVPKLGGQNADYIVAALKAYASGERPHSTMHAQASSLSERDMQDIGAYFAGVGQSN